MTPPVPVKRRACWCSAPAVPASAIATAKASRLRDRGSDVSGLKEQIRILGAKFLRRPSYRRGTRDRAGLALCAPDADDWMRRQGELVRAHQTGHIVSRGAHPGRQARSDYQGDGEIDERVGDRGQAVEQGGNCPPPDRQEYQTRCHLIGETNLPALSRRLPRPFTRQSARLLKLITIR